jgi:hypothetical protein
MTLGIPPIRGDTGSRGGYATPLHRDFLVRQPVQFVYRRSISPSVASMRRLICTVSSLVFARRADGACEHGIHERYHAVVTGESAGKGKVDLRME